MALDGQGGVDLAARDGRRDRLAAPEHEESNPLEDALAAAFRQGSFALADLDVVRARATGRRSCETRSTWPTRRGRGCTLRRRCERPRRR
ncbi:MAG: hypothetical protein U0326_02590 [Polyangiales bacterium]